MNKSTMVMGIDIGGSHISAALVDTTAGNVLYDTYVKRSIDSKKPADHIVTAWADAIHASMATRPDTKLEGIGIAIPGPFDYEKGISLMKGVNKYEHLYEMDLRSALQGRIKQKDICIRFENDAACFGLGECLTGNAAGYKRVIAVTLGTGLGSAFIEKGRLQKQGRHVPPDGFLYNIPYREGIAEDYLSGKWLVNAYNAGATANTGGAGKPANAEGAGSADNSGHAPAPRKVSDPKELATFALAEDDERARSVFLDFGQHLFAFLSDWIQGYQADCLVIGGSIAQSDTLFLPPLKEIFAAHQINIPVVISRQSEISAITGASSIANIQPLICP